MGYEDDMRQRVADGGGDVREKGEIRSVTSDGRWLKVC
jgi:hypothetical protein